MKRKLYQLFFAVIGLTMLISCSEDDESSPVPIAPIIKEVVFPSENLVMPGKEVAIQGKGFSKDDKVSLQGTSGQFDVEVRSATDNYIKILLPKDAGGKYKVVIERAGKSTTLDGELSVPFVIPVDNVVLPSQNVTQNSKVTIEGTGFETGDVIQLSSDFYPSGKVVNIPSEATNSSISFNLPVGCFGVNNVVVTRGNRKTNLGAINIEVNVGDNLGGGIVFWTDADKIHGLICNKNNTGSATEQFGPGVALSGAAGTSKALGSGAQNTAKLVSKMAAFRQNNPSWNNKKSAAEMCDELTVTNGTDTYTDWFLPSQEELIEIFKSKTILAQKGAAMPANNYWSSSEGDGDAAGWSAYYVNFYEAVNIVTGNSDKEGWKIGVRAVRSF